MKQIYVTVKINEVKKDFTFRTNNNGEYLFVGTSENRQLKCDDGYGDNSKTRKEIREYIKNLAGYDANVSRISYEFRN